MIHTRDGHPLVGSLKISVLTIMIIIKMNWDKKARSINLRPQSARPVKTANMLMALTKRMFPLKMLRIFHRKRHLLLSGHMRGSMFPMRITKLPRKTAKWYLHPSESRHRSARNVAVLIFPVV